MRENDADSLSRKARIPPSGGEKPLMRPLKAVERLSRPKWGSATSRSIWIPPYMRIAERINQSARGKDHVGLMPPHRHTLPRGDYGEMIMNAIPDQLFCGKEAHKEIYEHHRQENRQHRGEFNPVKEQYGHRVPSGEGAARQRREVRRYGKDEGYGVACPQSHYPTMGMIHSREFNIEARTLFIMCGLRQRPREASFLMKSFRTAECFSLPGQIMKSLYRNIFNVQ